MEVILLSKVDNLGELGDKVAVRPGYARNYLIPQGKAKFATAENIAEFETRRVELEAQASEALAEAKKTPRKTGRCENYHPRKRIKRRKTLWFDKQCRHH